MYTSPDVLVVGAGLAGLSAAHELHRRGLEVTVLEARERVGGRVHSIELTNGEVAELGAEWIMPGDDAVRGLAGELGLVLAESGVDYRRREAVGELGASVEEQEEALGVARAARKLLSEQEAAGLSVWDFLDVLPLTDRQRATLVARLQGTCAMDLGDVALRAMDVDAFTSGNGVYHRVASGNQSLATALAELLPDVRLLHAVEGVDQGGADITLWVVTERGGPNPMKAAAAVIAVPAPLAAELVFRPPLPAGHAQALRELPMGAASKLAVATVAPPTARAVQDLDVPYWCWAAHGEDGAVRPVLTAFAGSPAAQETLATGAGDPTPWLDRLRAMNPDVEPLGGPVLKVWHTDPFARGCYSAFDEASFERRELLTKPAGRLAFAGEHTAGEHHGTMEGAILSGRRAAGEIDAAAAGSSRV